MAAPNAHGGRMAPGVGAAVRHARCMHDSTERLHQPLAPPAAPRCPQADDQQIVAGPMEQLREVRHV